MGKKRGGSGGKVIFVGEKWKTVGEKKNIVRLAFCPLLSSFASSSEFRQSLAWPSMGPA